MRQKGKEDPEKQPVRLTAGEKRDQSEPREPKLLDAVGELLVPVRSRGEEEERPEVEEETNRPRGHGDGANGPDCGAAFALSVSGGERRGKDGRRSGRTGQHGWRTGTGGQLGGGEGRPLGGARGPGVLGRPDERDVAERARQPPPGGGEERQGPTGCPHLVPRGSGGKWDVSCSGKDYTIRK